jgi:hypothetical protein
MTKLGGARRLGDGIDPAASLTDVSNSEAGFNGASGQSERQRRRNKSA